MRNIVLTVIAIVILISTASYEGVVAQQAEQTIQVSNFEFVVELSPTQATFESRHGTSWTSLSWGNRGAKAMQFWVSDHSISGLNPGLQSGGFDIFVEATADGAILTSNGGTTWSELSFGCGGSTPCKFIVNESGVRGLSE